MNIPPRAPIICSRFGFEGTVYETVWWPPDEHNEFGYWDIVRAEDPYTWRSDQTFSKEFD